MMLLTPGRKDQEAYDMIVEAIVVACDREVVFPG